MDKLEKPVKGKNIKYLLDAFFNKYIRKHFNEVNSIDFIISDLGEQMNDGGRNIKILRNDNPVRTNNPDWFPPKPQQTDHICTFLKQLMDNELGTKDSYIGLKAEVVTETEIYTWDVKEVNYYESSGTVILRTDPRQGITIECPAIVRLYIYPLLTSKAVSSIIYNSIVTSNSKYNFILGERNIHKGEDNVWIFGKNNLSGETNHNSLINGYNNDVDSYGNIVIGDSNKHRSLLGATIGRYIKNFKQNSFLFGTGHDNSEGPSHEAVFGKYSKIKSDTVFAIGDGEDENNRHNLFELKSGGEILDKDGNDIRNSGGTQVQSDWNENDNTKPAYIKNKPNISSVPMVEITWYALKTLRDTSKLIPGVQYRITDYQCSTTATNTQSAGHQFDIIVIADSVNKLNENARACLHKGDSYFANSKLESWKLKYCLDNNIYKFAWADGNGKGVIYWMKDEYDNECGYDFKNIQFKRYKIIECEKCNDLVGCWAIKSNDIYVVGNSSFYFLTFSAENKLGNNIIKPFIVDGKQYLNNIVIIGDSATNNVFDNNCQNNTLMSNCFNNIFGPNCNENVLNSDCKNNILGSYCTNNCFAQKCDTNTLKGRCNNNVFGISCNSNIFGYHSNYNVLGYDCDDNILRCYCSNNKFYYQAYNNILENKCTNIEIEASHVFYIVVESGNAFIKITSTATTSLARPIRNIKIAQGVNNTETYKIISHNTINDNFQTIYKPINSQEIEI